MELSKLENENKSYRDSQTVGNVNVHALNIRLTSLQSQVSVKKKALESESKYITQLDDQIAASRNEWFSVDAETFTSGSCPTCGQNLPEKQLQAAKDQFEVDKKVRLSKIIDAANTSKQTKAMAEDRFTNAQEEVMQLEVEMASIREQITAAEAAKVEPKDMEHYAENAHSIYEKIKKLNDELADMMMSSAAVVEKLGQEKREIMRQISEQMAIVNKESLLEYSKQRIESLREDAKSAAECLEAIEKMLYLIDEYSRYKTSFVEDSINGLFRIARFRLFREQANGGVEDRCDVVYDGIPYISVNNGMKINLGIDIINTLSAAYGVRVPLFVDNAESVTNLEKCDSQIIRLVVSETDKELRVNYEN